MTARDLLVRDSKAYACSNSDLGEVLFNGVIIIREVLCLLIICSSFKVCEREPTHLTVPTKVHFVIQGGSNFELCVTMKP